MSLIKRISLFSAATYLLFGFLFWHFAKEMLQIKQDGWYVGQVNLYGDLVYHLALINKFLISSNVLIDNPIYAHDKVNYPIFVDYITSVVTRLTGVDFALFITTFIGGMIVLVVAKLFISTFIKNNEIIFLALLLFFLNSGFGFYYFFQDFGTSQKPFLEFLFNLPREYTDLKDLGYWWINPFLAYFLPQRGFLFAFPITLTVLLLLYRGYQNSRALYFMLAGLLAGTLSLVQAHSLFVIFLLSIYFVPLSLYLKKGSIKLLKHWVIFGIITAVVAYPLFQLISSVGNPAQYIRYDPGWTSKENFLWFWFKNLGFFAPLLLLSIAWSFRKRKIFVLYLPFLLIFVISNIWIFQPWEFDNSKLLIYWFFASCILVAYFFHETLLNGNIFKKVFAAATILIMIFSGSLDIFRTFTKVTSYQIYSTQDLDIASQTKLLTSEDSVFVTASNHNHPIPTLSGRSTLIGFHGWVWSHGADYLTRANDVSTIYLGSKNAEDLLVKYKVKYVTVGPQEIRDFSIDLSYFRNYPQISLGSDWTLYDVSSLWSDGNRQNGFSN